MVTRWSLMFKHRWRDPRDSLRAMPDDAVGRLERRIADSERHHSGEICVVVESALPLSYLWRVGPTLPAEEAVRQRALSWFGRLRVWDTEHNNGVLIYLQLAEQQVELVADRGLARMVDTSTWHALVTQLTAQVRSAGLEPALAAALDEVDALLQKHFPLNDSTGWARVNQLSNHVLRA